MKVHGLIDADNLAILSWELTDADVSDTLVLPSLLAAVKPDVSEVYADAGYLSSKNADAIRQRKATPFIKPRCNTKGRPKPGERDLPSGRTSEAFRDMVDSYQNKKEEWLKKYGKRNTIESCWSAIKRRFGHAVGASTSRMRLIESALKLIVWNLTRVTRPRVVLGHTGVGARSFGVPFRSRSLGSPGILGPFWPRARACARVRARCARHAGALRVAISAGAAAEPTASAKCSYRFCSISSSRPSLMALAVSGPP